MEEIKTPEALTVVSAKVQDNIVKPLADKARNFPVDWGKRTWVILLAVTAVGLLSGYALFLYKTTGTVRLAGRDIQVVSSATEEGVKDASTFRDTATGKLAENDGKITSEGTHILVRDGPSQNVYMTSSVVDLSKYIGKTVQVWGETFKGQKAGWLMDVGRIKVVN